MLKKQYLTAKITTVGWYRYYSVSNGNFLLATYINQTGSGSTVFSPCYICAGWCSEFNKGELTKLYAASGTPGTSVGQFNKIRLVGNGNYNRWIEVYITGSPNNSQNFGLVFLGMISTAINIYPVESVPETPSVGSVIFTLTLY